KALNFDKSDTFIVFSSVERIGIDDSWDAILEQV
ncbi:TPA: YihA family ribosome biogenesis GTP-binding protein, partial [Streptococcus pyogenes]